MGYRDCPRVATHMLYRVKDGFVPRPGLGWLVDVVYVEEGRMPYSATPLLWSRDRQGQEHALVIWLTFAEEEDAAGADLFCLEDDDA